jgi:cation/acetate symporter
VPLTFTVMVAVSITTRRRTPADVGATIVHARPETLRL